MTTPIKALFAVLATGVMAASAAVPAMARPGDGFGHGYGSMGDVGGGTIDYGMPTFRQGSNSVKAFIPCARIAISTRSPSLSGPSFLT